jgi:serine/threonine-protein kinase SRPK3
MQNTCISDNIIETLSMSDISDNDDEWEDVEDSDSEYIDKYKGDFNHGDIINGTYVLIKKIGYGTFSTVWLSYLLDVTKKNKYYAIKVHHQEDYDTGMRESSFLLKMKSLKIPSVFLHEIMTFIPLNSKSKTPSICFVFDVMTCSIADVIRMLRYEDGLDEKTVLSVAKQITITLNQLKKHKYLYTDVRPENMLIKSNNDQMDKFCELFDEFDYDIRWKAICEKICSDNKFDLTKKKHKEKFNKMKRELSIKLIKEKSKTLDDIVEDIPRNVYIDEHTKVYLSDFGSVEKYEKNMDDYELQSRNYRCPELLLNLPYNYNIDVWSLGCCMCEMLTTKCLIDPQSTKYFSIDYNHIFWIVELFGQFPKHMATKSKADENYFFKSGKFRLDNMEKDWGLHELFEYNDVIINDKTLTLIKSMLEIDPKVRISFDDILNSIDKI